MTDQNAITIQKSAVTPWASRKDVRELGNRIKELLPGANKLQPHEALALAQAAVAHNLDPFNGEIWFIPGRGLMAGIKGHRRAGHNQMQREGGGNYWVEFRGPLSVDELVAIKAPKDALAYECKLYDSRNITSYVEAVSKMTASGMPWEVVKSIMGDRPFTPGVGWYIPGESTKMTPPQCAQKRAEADALKRRFDLPFTMAVGVNGDADIIDGEFAVGHESKEEIQARMQAASTALRGDRGDIDLGPDWKAEPDIEGQELGEITTKEPTAHPDNSKTKPAALKFNPFVLWCNDLVNDSRASKYAREHGPDEPATANMFHVLNRVGKLGYTEVTEANAEEIKVKLQRHIEATE